MTPYLLVYDGFTVQRQAILDFLDMRPEVLNWYAFFPSGIFIISRHPSHTLSAMLHQRFPLTQFILTEIPAGRNNGWLHQDAWTFLNSPRSSGRWG